MHKHFFVATKNIFSLHNQVFIYVTIFLSMYAMHKKLTENLSAELHSLKGQFYYCIVGYHAKRNKTMIK